MVGQTFGRAQRTDGVHNELSLLALVLRRREADRHLLLALGGPQFLILTIRIIGNHRVRRPQNNPRRAVIPLQLNLPAFGKIPLETENIRVVRPAPGINRLIIIPHAAQIPMLLGEIPSEQILHRRSILKLIHHDIEEAPPVGPQHILPAFEQTQGPDNQIIEIHRVVQSRHLSVFLEKRTMHLIRRVPCSPPRFDIAEKTREGAQLGGFVLKPQLPGRLVQAGQLVPRVVNSELRTQSGLPGAFPQNAQPEGMKRGHGEPPRLSRTRETPHPLLHLPGGLVREGESQNRRRRDTPAEHVGDARGNHPGFTASRPGHDEKRTLDAHRGLALLGVHPPQCVLQLFSHA